MKQAILETLMKVADLLDQIPEEGIFEEKIIPDDDIRAQTDYTIGKMVRTYREFEKDPKMARIYGSLLRIRRILYITDLPFRQRAQWEDWFMASYLVNKWWMPDIITLTENERMRPADPRNWFPLVVQED